MQDGPKRLVIGPRIVIYPTITTVQNKKYISMKQSRHSFGKKKINRIYFITDSQLHDSKGHLKLRSYLHGDIIKSAQRIGKYINKNELYRTLPPRRVKYTTTNKIDNHSCVRNVTTMTPVLKKEKEIKLETVFLEIFMMECIYLHIKYYS